MELISNFTLAARLRVYWLSTELSALAAARSGLLTAPLTVAVRTIKDGFEVECGHADELFRQTLHRALAGSDTVDETQLTPFVDRLLAVVPEAVAEILQTRTGQETDSIEIPLHLPVLDRKTWKVRAALLPAMAVTAAGGTLYAAGAQPGGTRAAATLMAAELPLPVAITDTAAPLAFSYRDTMSRERRQRLADVLTGYGFGQPVLNELRDAEGDAAVGFTVSLTAQAGSLWAAMPNEKEKTFLPAWSPVTHAVQRALRAWLPLMALRTPAELAEMEAAPAILAYGATRSYCGRAKSQLTYDILDHETLKSAFYSINRALPGVMSHVYPVLAQHGYDESARHYRPLRLAEMCQMIRNDRRLLPALLQLDGLLITDFIEFATVARKVSERGRREPQRALSEAIHAGEDFGRRVQRRLGALLPRVDLTSLIDLALLEATAVLAPGGARQATLTINGKTYVSPGGSPREEQQCAA